MFKVAVVIFRECLEIAILLGIILAVTQRIKNSRIYIISGIIFGTVLASIFAFFTKTLHQMLNGMGDEVFDSAIMLITSLMISWTVVWMQGYASKIKYNLNILSTKITQGSSNSLILFLVVTSVILREGIEIVLIIYSIFSSEKILVADCIIGLGIGAGLGLAVGTILYCGLIQFADKYVFRISTILLALIAAGFSAKAAGILTSAGIIEPFSEQVWNSSWLIDDRHVMGRLLNVTVGYDSKPNGMQIIFYTATIALIVIMMQIRLLIRKNSKNSGKKI